MDINIPFAWFNGAIIACDLLNISVMSHSLHYATAVFEGEMSYNGKVFKLAEHTARLLSSAQIMDMQISFSAQDIIQATLDLLKANTCCQEGTYYVRPIIWRGPETLALAHLGSTACNIAINLTKYQASNKEQGLKLIVSPWLKIPPSCLPAQYKGSGNYTNLFLSKKYALKAGYDDALILDWQNYITECSTSNIFFVSDSCLITPIPHSCLNGITRQTIIELAQNLGIAIIERDISLNELANFTGGFMTGTALEIQPIQSITLTSGEEVKFTDLTTAQLLYQQYRQLVLS